MGNKYRIGRKIGSGSFGDIYLGEIALLYITVLILIYSNQAPTSSLVRKLLLN